MSNKKTSEITDFDAVQLFDSGGIFYLTDLPPNSEFGIDYHSWRTGEQFRGVKMIPPGLHFIYYSVADKYGQLGMRSGFFHEFKLREALVKRWNQQAECVEDSGLSESQLENFQTRKRELDRFLGPYPFDQYKRWLSLSSYLKEGLVKALVPQNGRISCETNLIGKSFTKSVVYTYI